MEYLIIPINLYIRSSSHLYLQCPGFLPSRSHCLLMGFFVMKTLQPGGQSYEGIWLARLKWEYSTRHCYHSIYIRRQWSVHQTKNCRLSHIVIKLSSPLIGMIYNEPDYLKKVVYYKSWSVRNSAITALNCDSADWTKWSIDKRKCVTHSRCNNATRQWTRQWGGEVTRK